MDGLRAAIDRQGELQVSVVLLQRVAGALFELNKARFTLDHDDAYNSIKPESHMRAPSIIHPANDCQVVRRNRNWGAAYVRVRLHCPARARGRINRRRKCAKRVERQLHLAGEDVGHGAGHVVRVEFGFCTKK